MREILLPGLLLDGEVVAVHHLDAHVARRGHQAAEMRD